MLNTVLVEKSKFIVFPLRLWGSVDIVEWADSLFIVNKACNKLFH